MQVTTKLESLGDVLEAAAARDLAKPRRQPPRLVIALLALAVIVPAAAFAGARLVSNAEVAKSLPAGTLSLGGTEPTCTIVKDGVEYHCVPRQGAEAGGLGLEGNCRADGRRDEAREWRLSLAEQWRHRMGVLHRTGGGRSADHRLRLPRLGRAGARRRLTNPLRYRSCPRSATGRTRVRAAADPLIRRPCRRA
jgi:hypothetical protein